MNWRTLIPCKSGKHTWRVLYLLAALAAAIGGTALVDHCLQIHQEYLKDQKSLVDRTGKIRIGSKAPLFSLPDAITGEPVCLQELIGHNPVVLLFGSFGCDVFCLHFDRLSALYEKHGQQAHFLFIYINSEPHFALPTPTPESKPSRALFPPPPAQDTNRPDRIRRGLKHFQIPFRCVVDGPDRVAEMGYAGMPLRLVIVDRAGRIAFDAGRPGPSGVWNLDEVDSWLNAHLH